MSETNIITDFQAAKQQYNSLKNAAQKAMQAEFGSLLTQAAGIFTEFKAEFGENLTPPAAVAKFVVNTQIKTRKPRTPKPIVAAVAGTTEVPEAEVSTSSPRKVAGLRKSFNSLTAKIAAAKAAGTPTQDLEDKLYEVQDALNLAGATAEVSTPEIPAPVVVAAATPKPRLGPVNPF